ncbi:MAG: tRNA (adenosine(37)-N6)-dimethylallyltransferase MiaA, partial [Caulobacteraceae bacterium]|nr:tRNA (adenosine(37)-N6)-dimethylallyltransferase MiaA [Caulobacteraceae bacterium]
MPSAPPIWLIAGPTASGKSALALRLAVAIGGEIVNADSMQLYRDLRVLTARPTPSDEAHAPHHLYGVADTTDAWSVGRWLTAAREILAGIAGRGAPAIVTGGTGLYFHALTRGLADIPPVSRAIEAATAEALDKQGEAMFRARLAAVDPRADRRIAAGDRHRLVRAKA